MKKYSWLTPVSILIFVVGTLIFLSPIFVPEDVNWPIKQKLKLGLDLRGGTQIVLTVVTKDLPEADRAAAVENNIRIIRNRIDQFGIAEPTIQKMGESDILVQLPGVKDPIAAENLIMKSAVLEFKLVAEPDIAEKFINQVDAIIQENLDKFPILAKLAAEDKALAKAETDTVEAKIGADSKLYVPAYPEDYVLPAAAADAIGGVKLAANQVDSVASTIAALNIEFNALLAKLKAAGIMAPDA